MAILNEIKKKLAVVFSEVWLEWCAMEMTNYLQVTQSAIGNILLLYEQPLGFLFLWEWITMNECLVGFVLEAVFFHRLNIYLLLFPRQDPSLSTPEQASLCEYVVASDFSLKCCCCSFISATDAFPIDISLFMKYEMTAGSFSCFFPLSFLCSFRWITTSGYILCEIGSTLKMWALSSEWPVLQCTPWITNILTFILFFSPFFSSFVHLSSLPSLFHLFIRLAVLSPSASLSCYFVLGATSKVVRLFPPQWRPPQHAE